MYDLYNVNYHTTWPTISKTRLYNLTRLNRGLNGKTGVYRGMHHFSYFAKNIDCGYSLEPPR